MLKEESIKLCFEFYVWTNYNLLICGLTEI